MIEKSTPCRIYDVRATTCICRSTILLQQYLYFNNPEDLQAYNIQLNRLLHTLYISFFSPIVSKNGSVKSLGHARFIDNETTSKI